MRTAINLGIAIALALALWNCGKSTPLGPSPTGQASVHVATDTAGAALRPTSVSWSCFTAGTEVTFGSPGGCPAPRLTLQAMQVAAAVTAAPTNLQRLVQGTTVSLAWGPPPAGDQPTSYVIEAGATPGSSNIATFDTGNAGTSLTVTNVPTGTYFVRVRGRDASGNGPPSNEVTVIVGSDSGPCGGPPAAPTSLAATAIGSTVVFTWVQPTTGCPPESYLIQAGSMPGSSNLAQVNTGGPTASYSVSGVPAGTYYVRVRGLSGSAVSSPTNEIVVTLP